MPEICSFPIFKIYFQGRRDVGCDKSRSNFYRNFQRLFFYNSMESLLQPSDFQIFEISLRAPGFDSFVIFLVIFRFHVSFLCNFRFLFYFIVKVEFLTYLRLYKPPEELLLKRKKTMNLGFVSMVFLLIKIHVFLFIIIFNFRLHHLIFLGLAIHITILKVFLT